MTLGASILLAVMSVAFALQSAAAALAPETAVRIRSKALGGDWLDGKVRGSPAGCTMVYLDRKTAAGYSSMAINSVDALQRRQGPEWIDVPVKAVLQAEPKSCREAVND